MLNYFPSSFVIYVWVFFGVLMMVLSVIGIRFAKKAGQFNEDIKYQLFSDLDDEIFDLPEEEIDKIESGERPVNNIHPIGGHKG